VVKRLDDGVAEETVGGWTFWRGAIDRYPVIVSRTMKGVASAAAATAIAIERYHPAAIVNQGSAGGHDPGLHVYDIVLGASSVSLGAFKTADRPRGRGSNPLEWTPVDLLASAGSASTDPAARTMRRFQANAELLAAPAFRFARKRRAGPSASETLPRRPMPSRVITSDQRPEAESPPA
jgi:adenosylhomocysteine nucleosidase